MYKKNLILILFLAVGVLGGNAQVKNPFKRKKKEEKKEVAAPAPAPKPATPPGTPKPFGEVITKDAKTGTGFFKVH